MAQTGEVLFHEPVLHAGIVKQAGNLAVAGSAGIGHRADLRRHGAVVSVAVVAGRRAQVSLLQQRLGMHARLPLFILAVTQRAAVILITGHHLLIRMAFRAGLGHVRAIDGRLQVVHRPNAMFALVLDRPWGLLWQAMQVATLGSPVAFSALPWPLVQYSAS